MDVENVVEEILNSVEADREEIEKKLREFLDYGVPLEQAKNALIRKYGGGEKEKKIKGIKMNERGISTIAKIITIEEREVEVKGKSKKIYRGLLGDETAVIPFTAWKDFGLQRGDVIKIKNASSSEWQGQPRISLSEWTNIEKIDEDIELVKREARKYNIIDLSPGKSNVEVRGKIASIEPRQVNIGEEKKTLYSGILEDETGRITFTAWKDFGLKIGDAIKIKGGYIRSWRGAPQLIFDENSEVEKIDEDIKYEPYVIPLYKVVERGGGIDLLMEGLILDIRRDSGIIFRCPKCGRKLKEGICDEHGQVDGVPDFRIRALVDDGTGAVDVLFDKKNSEALMEKSMQEFMKVAEEAMDYGIIYDEIVDKLLAIPVRVLGDSIQSDFIVSIIAKKVEKVKPLINEEVEEILTELGG